MANLILSRQAEADLDDIWLYIAEDNLENANRYLNKLHDKALMLSENPEIGVLRPELAEGLRTFPVDNYILYYLLQKDCVELVRVFHGSRDISMLF